MSFTADCIPNHNLGILPQKKGEVAVDGKVYEVKSKKENGFPPILSETPFSKDVVVIDGKEYEVNTAPDFMGNKQYVIIDGKEHNIHTDGSANGEAFAQMLGDKVKQFVLDIFNNKNKETNEA